MAIPGRVPGGTRKAFHVLKGLVAPLSSCLGNSFPKYKKRAKSSTQGLFHVIWRNGTRSGGLSSKGACYTVAAKHSFLKSKASKSAVCDPKEQGEILFQPWEDFREEGTARLGLHRGNDTTASASETWTGQRAWNWGNGL